MVTEAKSKPRPRRSQSEMAVARLTKVVENLTAKIVALEDKADRPTIPMTQGPEKDLERYLARSERQAGLGGMQAGESRAGIRGVEDFGDPNLDEALGPNDIVRLNDSVTDVDFQHKLRAFRESQKMAADVPLYGKILQLMGLTRNRRGPRKYKVHVYGVGKEGFRENELLLEKRAT